MHYDDLVHLIDDQSHSLDAFATILERKLAPEQIDEALLIDLRTRYIGSDEAKVLRAMLVGLRSCSLTTTAPIDLYALWLTRKDLPQITPDLLRVVAWGYAWAKQPSLRAKTLINLADCLFKRDDFEAALHVEQQALTVFTEQAFLPGLQKCLLLEASIFNELQRPTEAEATYQQLQAILRADSDDPGELMRSFEALLVRGVFYESLCDDLVAAEACYAEAEALLPRISNDDPLYGFRLALNQGILALRLGQYAQAAQAYDRAEAWLDQDDEAVNRYDLLIEQLTLALLRADQIQAQRYFQALQQLAQTSAGSLKQQAERHVLEALLTPDVTAAKVLLGRAKDVFQTLQADLFVVVCLSYLADLQFRHNDPLAARQTLREAETLLAAYNAPRRRLELQRIAAQYDQTMPLAEREQIAQTLEQYGDQLGAAAVWEAVGSQCEQDQPTVALHAYQRALDLSRQLRGQVQQRLYTIHLNQVRRRVTERAFTLSPDPAQKLAIIEQGRAQLLLDEITNAGLWRLLDQADLGEIRQAYQQLQYTAARLTLSEANVKRPTIEGEQQRLADLPARVEAYQAAERAYFVAIERIEATKAGRVGWLTAQSADLATIQAALPANGVLVNFMLVKLGQGHELHALVLRATGSPQNVLVAKDDEWELFLKTWKPDALIAGDQIKAKAQAHQALQEIYATFFIALEEHLTAASYLLIVLDESMPLYPLHAAYDGSSYLIERFAVSYVPSGSVLAFLQQRHAPIPRPTRYLFAGWDAVGDAHFPALPKIPEELAHLAELVGSEALHADHDPDQLRAQMSHAHAIHLMGHGDFPAGQNPRFAQLVTGRRRLYADDLYRSELVAELLFFDACYSGQVGPGLQGLVSAALVAGASRVIAAQWQVAYERARPLVRAFYQHWLAGASPSEALRRAQLDASKHHPPGAWAHFYLTGVPV